MVGKTISHYKILEKIGEGGMGEVFLAEDTSLDRKVALKFLADFLQEDPTAKKRFLREAKSAAALDHPYICKIYETGEEDGKSFISMEYVKGATLKEKLAESPLALKDALQKATEIAEALETAHKRKIVHRDLKPSNIMLTAEGHVKVTDFGLAKQLVPTEGVESQEQTITASLTKTGATLGTLAYMSPEQLRGEELDTRSDIFSFGVVLYEMLTSVHPFRESRPIDTASSILKEDPSPLSPYIKEVPSLLRHTVRKMLAKERDRRYQLVHDVRTDLGELISDIAESSTTQAGSDSLAGTVGEMGVPVIARSWRQMVQLVLLGLTTAALLISLVALWYTTRPAEQPPVRLHVQLPPDQLFPARGAALAVLSPDGKRLAYVVGSGEDRQLYVRSLDQLEATPLNGTEGAFNPFFSPDGQWVGFSADRKLKKVSVSGGAPLTLCDRSGGNGANWGPDDTIIFASRLGLSRVPAGGGTPEEITVPDSEKREDSHRYPQILPGGKWVLFSAGRRGAFDEANIVVQSLETGERKVLHRGGYNAHYVPTGHLVFMHGGNLFAAPFDLDRLEVKGSPAPILEGLRSFPLDGDAQFAFSQTGTLVYLTGGEAARRQLSLVWVDREGREEPLAAEPHRYLHPRISPDGTRLALVISDAGTADVWIYDLARETPIRLTFDPGHDLYPIWTPNGRQVVFRSNRDGGQMNLFWKAADGTGQAERLTTSPNHPVPYSISPDGKRLVFSEQNPETGLDLHVLSMEGEATTQALLQTQFDELRPAISPDGRWMAYQSNETGQFEVYVRPFPNVEEGKWQISREGGRSPAWGRDGRELFYRSGEAMMLASIRTEPTFTPGSPKVLFTGRYFVAAAREYDISLDGQHFLMIKQVEQTDGTPARDELIVVLNWFEELKRLVPPGE